MNTEYYNGAKLLSLKDLEGNTPELYLCTTNRTGGKTTYFSRLLVNAFLKKGEKFGLIYRFKNDMDNVADQFFKDINTLFFPEYFMRSQIRANKLYYELFIGRKGKDEETGGKPCGYAFALNDADKIKRYSHLFSDIERMFFDEFQSETNRYCSNEVEKFQSVHVSIARGQSKQWRYVPVYMCSNPVTILNPYYVKMGISDRLKDDTLYLKGNGFVLEQGFVKSAAKAQLESGVSKAFANSEYTAYSAQGVYLNDKKAFLEQIEGRSHYICTLRYNGKDFAIREYAEKGILYCDTRPDKTFATKISVTTDDHNINYVMLKRNEFMIQTLRYIFDHGAFRFKNLECKQAVMKALAY